VRLDTSVLDGEPLTRAANATLNFVDDQHDAVTVADAPQFLHKDRRSHDVSALTLHGFDEDRRNFFRGQGGLEQLFFDEARTAERKVVRILRAAHAAAL